MAKDVTKAKENMPADISAFEDMAGAGQEHVTADDLLIPRLTILQSLSPQLKKSKPEYIAGAEEGDICDVGMGVVIPKPTIIVPCFFATLYIEWAPEGSDQSFIKDHGTNAAILESCEFDEENFKYILPSGNTIEPTSTFYVLYLNNDSWNPAFLPLTGTQQKSGKQWLMNIRAERIQGKNGKFQPPMFYRSWEAGTAERSNNKGEWSVWTFGPGAPITEFEASANLFSMAKEFYEQARDGLVKGDLGNPEPSDNGSDDGAM